MAADPTPDQKAAHEFLTELRTRITTQPLPYQHGVEERALESLYEVFGHAREAMKRNPGCIQFARETTHVLNKVLRPVTAKWHRAKEEGRLKSRDGGDEFRSDLADVQKALRDFAAHLSVLAYGVEQRDELVDPPLTGDELKRCFAPVPSGISEVEATNGGIAPGVARDINADEACCVAARRGNRPKAPKDPKAPQDPKAPKAPPPLDAVGLALSGGGIRSATFSLGVVQVLAGRGLLRSVDFLSTVSGGGYTGTFVATRLAAGVTEKELGGPHGPDPKWIQSLRRRAKFLAGRNLAESWSMFLETVLGMLVNWCVPLVILVVAAFCAICLERCRGWDVILAWGPPIVGSVAFLSTLGFFHFARGTQRPTVFCGWVMALAWLAAAVLLAVWGLDWGMDLLGLDGARWTWPQLRQAVLRAVTAPPRTPGTEWGVSLTTGGLGLGMVVSLIPMILRYVPLLANPRARKLVVSGALLVGALVVPALGLVTFYALVALGALVADGESLSTAAPHGLWGLAIAAGALVLVMAVALNLNVTGPHRLYKRGLERTFIDPEQKRPAAIPLDAVDPDNRAPYHLINTAVNLPASEHVRLSERKCDFFLFSRDWAGSPAVGYAKAGQWRMNNRPPDLATAMAISGAAISSSMGLGSIKPLRALLALFNLRLGFWIRNAATARWASRHPGFRCLLREMSTLGMTEKSAWLNLSDGGHIENLGVYELLRRRCKFILCVDGEADPDIAFHGLMTLIRHARIDLGVSIQPDLQELRPDPATGYSRAHYHLCRIAYPARPGEAHGDLGLLLYLKLSVTGNESELIRRYRKGNPTFPHQTTLDQFFDEEQFEAYRQLGVHVAEGLFSRTLMNDRCEPDSIPVWFRQLAENLLVPADHP